MSLIQVSSTQKMFSDNDGLNNTGHKFSNHFQSVLKIPPHSKIALDNAIFMMSSLNLVPLSYLSTDNKKVPYIKLLFADDEKTYLQEQSSIGKNSTMIPFTYPIPDANYNSVNDFWEATARYLSLDPRPSLYKSFTTNQSIISGGTFQQNIISTFKPQNSSTQYLKNDSELLYDRLNKWTASGTSTEYIKYTLTSENQGNEMYMRALFSRFSGLSNMNGSLEGRLRTPPGGFTVDGKKVTSRKAMFGINRWVDAGSNSNQNHQKSWHLSKFTNDFKYYDDTVLRPYTLAYFLKKDTALSLDFDVGDYFFMILNRSKYNSNKEELKFGNTTSRDDPQAVSICKLEKGGIYDSNNKIVLEDDGHSRLVVMATGDVTFNEFFNIPYSAYLDPTHNDFISGGGTAPYWLWNEGTANDGNSDMKILINGNKVSFMMNNNTITAVRSFHDWDNAGTDRRQSVHDYIDDKVFPLQFSLGLSKKNDIIDEVKFKTTCSSSSDHEVVKDVSKSIEDTPAQKMKMFIAQNKMIPASIILEDESNVFESPTSFYPIQPTATDPFFSSAKEPKADVINSYGYIQRKPFIIVGQSELFDTYQKHSANISRVIDFKPANMNESFVSVQEGSNWTKTTSTYSLTQTNDPFINGIHVLLKDLPNDSTMGSINQANSSKLVAVINNYERLTGDEINETDVYAYNKNERLYIDLHNPTVIETNKLSIELVDRFGNYLASIVDSLLTFHLASGNK